MKNNFLRNTALFVLVAALGAPVLAEEPRAWAEKHLEELVTLYRHFHSHPELSFAEKETAARLASPTPTPGFYRLLPSSPRWRSAASRSRGPAGA